MPAYVLVQVNVTDPDAYDDYKKLAQAAVQQYGGKYIVRGGAAEDVENERPYPRVVVLEFPDMDAARTWYHSPEYQAAKAAREGAGVGVFTILEGVE
jgi:uncharacterized protein (DUF1330 family)